MKKPISHDISGVQAVRAIDEEMVRQGFMDMRHFIDLYGHEF